MLNESVVIIGLPASGKTTFLAALWHLITARDVKTALSFQSLNVGDVSHLNVIAARWREARVQDRTQVGGSRVVSMNLKDVNGRPVRVTFPDMPGEVFRSMWEERECDQETADVLIAGGVLLFVHSDTIRAPTWVVDEVELARAMGLEVPPNGEVPWHPRLAPTQVQLVDLLQLLRSPPLDVGPRRLAVILSAWDKASDEGMSPELYLAERLPLLNQYLQSKADGWIWRTYGLSAQGGDYDPADSEKERVPDAEVLRNLNQPSDRIQLTGGAVDVRDLTEPLEWLMNQGAVHE